MPDNNSPDDILELKEVVTLGKQVKAANAENASPAQGVVDQKQSESLAKDGNTHFPDPTPENHVVDPNEELALPSMDDVAKLLGALGAEKTADAEPYTSHKGAALLDDEDDDLNSSAGGEGSPRIEDHLVIENTVLPAPPDEDAFEAAMAAMAQKKSLLESAENADSSLPIKKESSPPKSPSQAAPVMADTEGLFADIMESTKKTEVSTAKSNEESFDEPKNMKTEHVEDSFVDEEQGKVEKKVSLKEANSLAGDDESEKDESEKDESEKDDSENAAISSEKLDSGSKKAAPLFDEENGSPQENMSKVEAKIDVNREDALSEKDVAVDDDGVLGVEEEQGSSPKKGSAQGKTDTSDASLTNSVETQNEDLTEQADASVALVEEDLAVKGNSASKGELAARDDSAGKNSAGEDTAGVDTAEEGTTGEDTAKEGIGGEDFTEGDDPLVKHTPAAKDASGAEALHLEKLDKIIDELLPPPSSPLKNPKSSSRPVDASVQCLNSVELIAALQEQVQEQEEKLAQQAELLASLQEDLRLLHENFEKVAARAAAKVIREELQKLLEK